VILGGSPSHCQRMVSESRTIAMTCTSTQETPLSPSFAIQFLLWMLIAASLIAVVSTRLRIPYTVAWFWAVHTSKWRYRKSISTFFLLSV
jgi:hypothetical protein